MSSINGTSLSQITLSSLTGGNIFNLLGSNLTANQNVFLGIGTSISVGNSGYINFINTTAGSISNSMNLGIIGISPQLTIQNNGFVGINNMNPSYQLDIIGTSRHSGIALFTNTSASTGTGSGSVIISGGVGINGSIYGGSIFSNGSQVLTNASNTFQSISITGTTASTNTGNGALTVAGGVGIGGDLYCNSLNASSTSQITLSGTGVGNALNLLAPNLGGTQNIYFGIGTSISGGNLGYINFINVTSGSSSNSMNFGIYGISSQITIQNNGFVGINTQNPLYRLDVTGQIRTTSGFLFQGNPSGNLIDTNNTGGGVKAVGLTISSLPSTFTIGGDPQDTGRLLSLTTNTVGTSVVLGLRNINQNATLWDIINEGSGNTRLLFQSIYGGTIKNPLTLDANTGFVGINNLSPTFPLDVSGQMRVSSILTIGNSSASTYLEILGSASSDTRLYSHSDGNTYLQSAGLFTISNINSISSRITVDNSGLLTTANGLTVNSGTLTLASGTVATSAGGAFIFLLGISNCFQIGGAGTLGSTIFLNLPTQTKELLPASTGASNIGSASSRYGAIHANQANVQSNVNIGTSTGQSTYPLNVTNSFNTTVSSPFFVNATGSVNGPATNFTGNFSAIFVSRIIASEFWSISDQREKCNITDLGLTECLEFVKNIKPVTFSWNDSKDQLTTGYIAQEVFKKSLISGLVHSTKDENMEEFIDEDGFCSPAKTKLKLSYEKIIPILHKVILNVMEKNKELEERLSILENK